VRVSVDTKTCQKRVEYLRDGKVPKKFFAVRIFKSQRTSYVVVVSFSVEGRKREEKARPKAHSSAAN
jgi:hypothetical protein